MRTGNQAVCIAGGALALMLSGCATTDNPDPWRSANQGVFAFNEAIDIHALEPVAKGWRWAVPDLAQEGITNFFDNLGMPQTMVNDLLQGKPGAAGHDLLRLVINTTFGVAGFIDVATPSGVPENDEDFGQTLGVWGVGPGPYVVLPLLGPSTVRDALALPVDGVSSPTFWLGTATWYAVPVRVVNSRAQYIDEIDENRREAVNYYLFVRDAWLQNREQKVRDGAAPVDEDLYDLEDIE